MNIDCEVFINVDIQPASLSLYLGICEVIIVILNLIILVYLFAKTRLSHFVGIVFYILYGIIILYGILCGICGLFVLFDANSDCAKMDAIHIIYGWILCVLVIVQSIVTFLYLDPSYDGEENRFIANNRTSLDYAENGFFAL